MVIYFLKHSKTSLHCRDVHLHNTRNSSNYFRTRYDLKLTERSPMVNGEIWYNKLPREIKTIDSEKVQGVLKDYLLTRPLYSFSEF